MNTRREDNGQQALFSRMMRLKKEEAVHSSGYARAQYGKKIGSTSAESFTARQAIEANRQVVGRYGESEVGGARNATERVKGYSVEKDEKQREAIREKIANRDEARGGGLHENEGFESKNKGEIRERFAGIGGGAMGRNEGRAPAQPPARRNPGIAR